MKSTRPLSLQNRFKSQGYLRWKKQLLALKRDDLHTVKRLAQEAKEYLQLKNNGVVQLALR